jgi:hypothetical protein
MGKDDNMLWVQYAELGNRCRYNALPTSIDQNPNTVVINNLKSLKTE